MTLRRVIRPKGGKRWDSVLEKNRDSWGRAPHVILGNSRGLEYSVIFIVVVVERVLCTFV